MRVVLVEDDLMIGESVQQGLRQDGFAIDWVQDGEAAELALRTTTYALVLLDLGLPHKNGLEILTTLRCTGQTIPVLILTACDAVTDRVQGLDSGADDYLIKPFAIEELAARMRALLRRRHGRAGPLLMYGDLTLNLATHQVRWREAEIALASREFAVLHALLEHPGAILSRAQLEERLYSWNEEVASNAVEVHIHHLRQKLDPALIRTVRGIGYMVPKMP
jgi:two-component system response regulator QseB